MFDIQRQIKAVREFQTTNMIDIPKESLREDEMLTGPIGVLDPFTSEITILPDQHIQETGDKRKKKWEVTPTNAEKGGPREDVNRQRGLGMLAPLLCLCGGVILAACGAGSDGDIQVKPFSIENYCQGSLTLKTEGGRAITGPEKCGNFTISADSIDDITDNGTLIGRELLQTRVDVAEGQISIGGTVDTILVKEELPDCVQDIVAKKEWSINNAVASFLEKSGTLAYFVGKDNEGYFLGTSGYTIIDATAIHETFATTTTEERECLRGYDPETFTTSYFSLADSYPTLAESTADGTFSKREFCQTLTTALAYVGSIQTDSDTQTLSNLYSSINCDSGK